MKFADAPIRRKITLLMVLISTTALVLLAGAVFFIEINTYRETLVDKVGTLADLLAANSRQGLILNNRGMAEEVLASLAQEPHVRAAFLFRNGRPFARFLNPGDHSQDSGFTHFPCRLLDKANTQIETEHLFSLRHLGYVRPIYEGDRLLGQLYIQSDLDDLRLRLVQFTTALGVLIVLAVAFSLILSTRLQSIVSNPVLRLLETMQEVSRKNDFTLRVEPEHRDEIGSLMSGFNRMLSQIEARDRELEVYRHDLEALVRERTEQLRFANQGLLQSIEQLEEAKKLAEEANRSKSQFLANMSHEIRTPMIGVLGMTELLFNTGLSEKQRHLAETVFKSGESLLEILNDLLDISKIEAGKLELVATDFDLLETIEEVLGLMGEKARQKSLELHCSMAPGTPTALKGDAGRLRQILLNLVGNAIKFTEQGEVSVRACPITRDKELVRLRIEVEDTGIGILAEHLETVFDTFVQADNSATRRHGGTGLGLAIVKQLASLMKGSVGVRSQPGVGSCFYLELPFAISAHLLPTVQIMPEELHGKRLLVVEDDPSLAASLRSKLLEYGFQVEVAGSGAAALKILRDAAPNPFSLAFLDMSMAGLGGIRLVEAIAAERTLNRLKIVLVCDHDDRVLDATDSCQRIAKWLYKPVRPSVLRETLVEVLREEEDSQPPGTSNLPASGGRDWAGSSPEGCILLAEDNPVARDLVASALTGSPVRLLIAEDGQQALQLLADHEVSLILMDCQMPVLDGFEAARQIRARGDRTPIVALTARVFPHDLQLCREAGMDDYLLKPFRQKDLIEKIKGWLDVRNEEVG